MDGTLRYSNLYCVKVHQRYQRNASSSKNFPPTILQKASVKIVNRKKCQKMFNVPNQNGYTAKINKKMICAASEGKDACQGDSGGMYV